jgi:hypothetical protein
MNGMRILAIFALSIFSATPPRPRSICGWRRRLQRRTPACSPSCSPLSRRPMTARSPSSPWAPARQ